MTNDVQQAYRVAQGLLRPNEHLKVAAEVLDASSPSEERPQIIAVVSNVDSGAEQGWCVCLVIFCRWSSQTDLLRLKLVSWSFCDRRRQ
jgi:hypothetical protein